MISTAQYRPQKPLITTRIAEANLFGFRRMARKPPAIVLPVFLPKVFCELHFLFYQQGNAEGYINNFVGDPDLKEFHLIKADIAEACRAVRIGEFMIHAYEFSEGKFVVARGNDFRDRMHQLMLTDIFDQSPFAGLEVAQFTNDLISEKSFAAICARELMARSRQLALSWIEGDNLSAEAKEIARSILAVPKAVDSHISMSAGARRSILIIEMLNKMYPNHDNWADLWLEAWGGNPTELVRESGLKWLREVQPNHAGWVPIWLILWRDAMPRSKEATLLIEMAQHWIAKVDSNNANWASVWKRAWRSMRTTLNDRSGLAHLAHDWLSNVSPDHRSWSSVWRELWQDLSHTTRHDSWLADFAEQWLRRAPPNHTGWAAVWERLYSSIPPGKREDLAQIAVQWLHVVDPKHASWASVWVYLWGREPNAERYELVAGALSWLEVTNPRHRGWPGVWQALLGHFEADANIRNQLIELGLTWLSKTKKKRIPGTDFTRTVLVEALQRKAVPRVTSS
jgi:hypothetical protein